MPVNFSLTVSLSRTLATVGNAEDDSLRPPAWRAGVCLASEGLRAAWCGCSSFLWPTELLCDWQRVVSVAEEPVSTRVGWTNIYTSLVGGMKPATCPAWSVITWRRTSGVTCPACLSHWQLTPEQCTVGRYTFRASQSSTFCSKFSCKALSWLVPLCLIHRGRAQWGICPVAILLWPCHGRLGSETRHEHETRHPHSGCNEWSPVCNWRKSFERSFFCFVLITITFASHVSC